jgi:hypothetical protein
MLRTELILNILIILIFLFLGKDPRRAFGLSPIKVRVINVLAFILADLKPEVASLLSGNRLEEIILIDRFGRFG